MNKKAYIIPVTNIVTLNVENMMAVSGPQTTDTAANESYDMETKSNDWDIWDE